MGNFVGKKVVNPVARRLKEARQNAGLSQKKLGVAASIDEFSSSARMNQYETGKHTPDFSTLERIAKVLNVPTAFFYAVDNCLAELIVKYGKLKQIEKTNLLDYIDKMLSKK